jgi:transcriptional regulator with XRE-family HTH domain
VIEEKAIELVADTPATPKIGRRPTLSEALRQCLRESRVSRYKIGQRARISSSDVRQFLNGERDLKLRTAERLADLVGMDFVMRPKVTWRED